MTVAPLVYLITDGTATNNNFEPDSARILELIRVAVRETISLVQIREKNLTARNVFELTRRAAEIVSRTTTKLLVNDRADIALAAKADGVHLTAKSLSAQIVRQNFGADFIIGASCHSLETILTSKNDAADFAVFSPIFYSPNKGEPQGLEVLREVCTKANDFPILALGGVDESNFQQTLDAGAKGIAAVRLLNDVERLSRFAKQTRRA